MLFFLVNLQYYFAAFIIYIIKTVYVTHARHGKGAKDEWDVFSGYGPLVTATNLLFGPEREAVRFITRTEPRNQYDTGWTFFSGFEQDGYIEDPDNYSIAPLASFLELDPSLKPLVDSPVGSTWEKTPDSEEWEPVDDFQVED